MLIREKDVGLVVEPVVMRAAAREGVTLAQRTVFRKTSARLIEIFCCPCPGHVEVEVVDVAAVLVVDVAVDYVVVQVVVVVAALVVAETTATRGVLTRAFHRPRS